MSEIDVTMDCDKCKEFQYNKGKAEAIEELVDEYIEQIEEISSWYKEEYKEINDVQICIVLDDLNHLIECLKEQKNEV